MPKKKVKEEEPKKKRIGRPPNPPKKGRPPKPPKKGRPKKAPKLGRPKKKVRKVRTIQNNLDGILAFQAKRAKKKQELVLKTYDLLKAGTYTTEVYRILMEDDGLAKRVAEETIGRAMKIFKQQTHQKMSYNISLHLKRYEVIYNETLELLDELEEDDVELFYRIAPTKYGEALQTLRQKEQLLGYHRKSFRDQIAKGAQDRKKAKPSFDLSKLSLQEKVDLRDLLFDCRVDKEDGIQPIRIKGAAKVKIVRKEEVEVKPLQQPDTVIEDIEFEKIDGKEPLHPIDVLKKEGKTLLEIKKTIKANEEELFKKLLKNKKQGDGKIII